MMTSVVADAARGNRDRAQPQTSHTSQPQATAEQIRLAQIIDKNDADFEGKVKQLIEVTGRNQDECMVALHDCHGDVNRAINFLLEEVIVTDSWETVGKKKSVGKEGATVETKERKVEKEGRGRGAPNRRSRGASRAQDGRTEENGFDSIPGERGERGRRGRGRGSGGRGRGRGDGVNRFSQGMGSLYTADYTGSADSGETAANNTTDGAGNWRNNLEDWAAEDWNEDLSETKVFTASFALASQSHATPGQGGDLGSLLPKGADVDSDLVGMERASPEPLTLSLVFTNSQQHATPTQAHRYASAAANSYASAAAGTYAQAASSLGPRPPQPDVLKTEPVSVSRITPVSSQPAVVQTNSSPFRESCPPAAAPAPLALTEPKYEVPVTVTHMDLKAQPDPSPILSQLTQQQNSTLLSDLPAQGRNPSPTLPLRDTGSPVLKPLGETSAAAVAESHQPKQIRAQRRRIPPPSKIPSSAVEMPGSADVFGLNVQFGALDFASEPAVESTGQSEASIQEPDPPVAQTQSSMYSKQSAVSEPVTVLPPALPAATMEPRYTSPSMGLPTATAPTPSTSSRTESSSLQMEPTPISSATTLTNGFSDVQPSVTQDAVPSSTPQSMAKALMSENGMAASTLPLCVSAAAPTPSTVLPSLSSHVSSGTTLGAAVPASTGLSSHVASDVSGSLSAFSGSVLTSNGLSNGAPGLSTNCPSAPSTGRSAPLQTPTTTAKAPPNLPQGVPPLLANQYIMGPGGLLPAYPIYGFEDLQMMQSRLPIDYYGMAAFPGTALAARDGGLANNPYSGEATKYARGDAPSPAPTTSLSSVAPSQSDPGAVPPQSQAPQNPGQAFLNPPLPPGYGYTSLPYYTGMPGVPSAFQYGPTVFMPPASAKQHAQYQHQAGYGGHAYASGFDDMSQAHAGDYGKGYGSGTQSQAKSNNSTGKVPGLSGSAGSDLGTAVYSKTQSFDKQGFSTVAPATFSLPSALGGTGPLNPGGAPGGYAPAPFLHILPPHQQPPSQILHHHIPQDTQGQRSQSSSMQKSQGKTSYNSSPYWAN